MKFKGLVFSVVYKTVGSINLGILKYLSGLTLSPIGETSNVF
jgi:hypothetical protein